ncbi:ABC transporter related [Rubrobacter xylanophilus DSM 9941]|uniref:ABC transporter related n=1 Tax=Rubrobacter xylanophilus (strain DSM 9941 / JCM 11954 / NBRC 16129 / PRD-1) TaxID=266117 RepID=Q1AZ06_RUBXD|nr:sugar ABC transporter ATP-binding protein [Rubrobacter xylanophilus]ABG03372.1 ABC transporter related [Rubrobacter xylanophilus DSM 9941]
MPGEVSLSARHLAKRYGGVVALADGNLEVSSGEVVALMGANGSGKSTLGKIITGAVVPDSGTLLLDGEEVRFSSPHAARRAGIAAVYQELSLIPDMTVAENVWLAHEPLSRGLVKRRERRERTARLLELFRGVVGPSLGPDALVSRLSPGERQIVEILKALSAEPRLMILDEATASLDGEQVARLFELVGGWKAQGRAVVFVSHRMEEIFRIADRAVVLRSGRTVGEAETSRTTEQELISLMIEGGVTKRHIEHPPGPAGGRKILLRAEDLRAPGVRGVSLELARGEILGLGGLQGQGQPELLRALFGALPRSGRLLLGGREVRLSHPRQAMREGMAFVPGDRGREGLLRVRSILENLMLPSWRRYGRLLDLKRARRDAERIAGELRIVMGSLDDPVDTLSGGNAQKVVLGKWLLRAPQILLLDDPTKGVDVGAKGELYAMLGDLRKEGVAILLYSSDDEELLGLCDRVLVMREGRVRRELKSPELTRSALVKASVGTEDGG